MTQPNPRDINPANTGSSSPRPELAHAPRPPALRIVASRHAPTIPHRIIFLAANPTGTGRLRIDQEARDIEGRIRESLHRDAFAFKAHWALRVDDLQRILLDERPTIVHFSGHGGGKQGIVVHGDGEEAAPVSTEALGQLFAVLGDGVRIVLLNACYTLEQADAIRAQVDIVIGMSATIDDHDARHFAAAFYRALCSGRSVGTAFRLGLNAIELHGSVGVPDMPVLRARPGVDPEALVLGLPAEPGHRAAAPSPRTGRSKLTAPAALTVLLIAVAVGLLWRCSRATSTWLVTYDYLMLNDTSIKQVLEPPTSSRGARSDAGVPMIRPAELSSDTAGDHLGGWAAWREIFRAARDDTRPDQTYILLHITNRGNRTVDEIDLTATELRMPTRIRTLAPGEWLDVPVIVTGRHANLAHPQRLSFTIAEERSSGDAHVVRLPALEELAFREIGPNILRGAPP